jgi:hypothetical protein
MRRWTWLLRSNVGTVRMAKRSIVMRELVPMCLVLLLACDQGVAAKAGGEPQAPKRQAVLDIEQVFVQMTSFRDRLCACQTEQCTAKLVLEMRLWAREQEAEAGWARTLSGPQEQRASELDAQLQACITLAKSRTIAPKE